MPEWLTGILSLSREVSTKVALPLFLFMSAVLFAPAEYAENLGIDAFRDEYRLIVGIFFLFSLCVLVANMMVLFAKYIGPMIEVTVRVYFYSKALYNLTDDEKSILRRFIVDGQSTVYEDISSGPINALVLKSIVVRASNLGAHHKTFSYILQPWAQEYLKKKPHLLD